LIATCAAVIATSNFRSCSARSADRHAQDGHPRSQVARLGGLRERRLAISRVLGGELRQQRLLERVAPLVLQRLFEHHLALGPAHQAPQRRLGHVAAGVGGDRLPQNHLRAVRARVQLALERPAQVDRRRASARERRVGVHRQQSQHQSGHVADP